MKYFVLGIGAVAVCFFAIVFLALLAGAQREYFGNFDGNSLLSVEIAFVIVLIVTVSLWRQGKRFLGISIAFFGLSLFLAFLGWFIHPDQVFSRAVERLADWETAIERYKLEQTYGQRDPDAQVRFQRLAQELAARRSEYYAAQTRYRGEPEFFRSSFFAWNFWILSGLGALGGLVAYKKHTSSRRSSEA